MAMIEHELSPRTTRTTRRAAGMLWTSPLLARNLHLPVWVSRAMLTTALVGLLVWNVTLQRQIREARMIQNMVVTDHQPTDLKPQGLIRDTVKYKVVARMFLGPSGDDAVLVIENLPAPPPGKVYQVWIADDKHQLPMHTFQVSHTIEQVLMQTDEPFSQYKWVMITVEDEGGSPSPSKDTILLGDL
jgi:hypothetical protein